MRTRVCVAMMVVMTFGVGLARAAVLEVPSEYSSINEAIQAADVGDIVLVAPASTTKRWSFVQASH